MSVYVFFLPLILCACSLEGSILSLGLPESSQQLKQTSSLKSFVPGGDIRTVKTVQRQYQIQATVGSTTDQIKQTTARKYTLYSSVEGSMISDRE